VVKNPRGGGWHGLAVGKKVEGKRTAGVQIHLSGKKMLNGSLKASGNVLTHIAGRNAGFFPARRARQLLLSS